MVNKLIGALIVVVLGLALLPLVVDTVTTLTQAGDVGPPEVIEGIFYDTTVGTLLQAIPILYVIMIVVGVTGYFYLTRK